MPTFTGTTGNDTFTGGSGADTIDGLAGNDVLHGGAGNDQIDGGSGQDQTFGDDGDDLLIVSAAPVGGEIYDGGADIDTLRFLTSAGTLVITATDPLSPVTRRIRSPTERFECALSESRWRWAKRSAARS